MFINGKTQPSKVTRLLKIFIQEFFCLILVLVLSAPQCIAQCHGSEASSPVTVLDEVSTKPNSRQLTSGGGTSVNLNTAGKISIDANYPGPLNISTYSAGATFTPAANTYTRVTSATQINLPGTASVPVGTTIGLTIGGSQGSTTIHTNGGSDNENIIFNGSLTNTTINIKKGDQIVLANQGSGTWMVTSFLAQGGSDGSAWTVTQGGSGTNTLTTHGVVLGNGTGAVNVTSAGTAGYVLTSNGASSDPTWEPGGGTTQATFTANNPQYTVPATPGEMITFYGSASKLVKILRIELLTEQTTAGTNFMHMYRRTSAASGGTPNTVTTAFPHNGANSPTATMTWYTANPTVGSGTKKFLDAWDIQSPAAASNIQPNWKEIFNATVPGAEPIILSGTAEGISFNLNGVALPAGFKIQARIMWTEE